MDKGMLTDATSTDDSPTPGYMLNEIAHATVGSYAACTQLIDFLNARLKKNNHNVKYKCCVIIKHVCRSGRADFKKDMARNLDSLKECLQYKGVPDPLRGDEIYRRVREAAKEALDAIFDSQQPVSSTNPNVASRIQGFSGGQEDDSQKKNNAPKMSALSSFTSSAKAMLGLDDDSKYAGSTGSDGNFSSSFDNNQLAGGGYVGGGGTGVSAGTQSSMTGIGNPNFQDPRKIDQNSLASRIGAAASGVFSKMTSSSSTSSNFSQQNTFDRKFDGGGDDYQLRSNRPHDFGNNQNQNKSDVWTPSSNGNISTFANTSSNQLPPNPNPIVPDLPISSGGTGRAGSASTGGEYERGLIQTLCAPGGMKAVPQEDKLAAFLRTAPTLSAELVGNALLEFMNEDAWQSRVKALIVLCRLMNTSGCEEHAVWWADNGEEDLIALRGDSKASVRTQAAKALRLIGLEGEVAAVMETAKTKHQGNNKVKKDISKQGESLLDFNDTNDIPPAHMHPPNQDLALSSDDNIFSGLSIGMKPGGGNVASEQNNKPLTSVFDTLDSKSSHILSFNEPESNPPRESARIQQGNGSATTASDAISSLDFMSHFDTKGDEDNGVPTRSRQSSVDASSFDFMGGNRSRSSSIDRSSITGFDFMGGSLGSGGGAPSNMHHDQQQQLLMQQQQQLMHLQQQQLYLHHHHPLQGDQHVYPLAGQGFSNVMGGIGMGRKHIPNPVSQQGAMGSESGFSFRSDSQQSPSMISNRKSQPGDAFNFVSETVASKKAATQFSNKIT